VVLELDLGLPNARHGTDRIVGVGHHQPGEIGRAEIRRESQPDVCHPVRGHGARRDETERGHWLVQLGVAHRA
jgi:hypothetical protein